VSTAAAIAKALKGHKSGCGYVVCCPAHGFADYTRLIPAPSGNAIAVEADALISSVKRLVAIADDAVVAIGRTWGGSRVTVCLTRQSDVAEDIEPITLQGSGRVALQPHYLVEQLRALGGQLVVVDHVAVQITRRTSQQQRQSSCGCDGELGT
jgi:hypothetical protein